MAKRPSLAEFYRVCARRKWKVYKDGRIRTKRGAGVYNQHICPIVAYMGYAWDDCGDYIAKFKAATGLPVVDIILAADCAPPRPSSSLVRGIRRAMLKAFGLIELKEPI